MRRQCLFVLTLAVVVLVAVPAEAADAEPVRDISYPQCGAPMPTLGSGGIIGVNGGRAFTVNPCLSDQLGWSKSLDIPPAFYTNTGNPGPWRSARWPYGQDWPEVCSSDEPNSVGCSFDYGWNAAKDSFETAMDGAQEWNGYDRDTARRRVANVDWWLDVEILNSWQTIDFGETLAAQERDTATLVGAVRALWDVGVQRVGIYSTNYQWNLITGGTDVHEDWFAANPVWLAGYNDHEHATEGCSDKSFTGGPVLLTQYLGDDGFDANVSCQ